MASLAVLTQYRLAKFQVLETNDSIAEYSLLHDKVLLMLRYPRYIQFIRKKFGIVSALLVEELLESSISIAQSVIIRAYAHSETKNDNVLKEFRDSFLDLVNGKYFVKCPEVSEDTVPQLKVNQQDVFKAPELDLKDLKAEIESGAESSSNIYWTVNFDVN